VALCSRASGAAGGRQRDDIHRRLSPKEAPDLFRADLGYSNQGLVRRTSNMRSDDDIRQLPKCVAIAGRLVLPNVKRRFHSDARLAAPFSTARSSITGPRAKFRRKAPGFIARTRSALSRCTVDGSSGVVKREHVGRGTNVIERQPPNAAFSKLLW